MAGEPELPPPPAGFEYRFDAAGNVLLDEKTGKPALFAVGEGGTVAAASAPSPAAAPAAPDAAAAAASAAEVAAHPGGVGAPGAAGDLAAMFAAQSDADNAKSGAAELTADPNDVKAIHFVPDTALHVVDTTKGTVNKTVDAVQDIFDDPTDAAQDALRNMSDFAQDFFKFISRGNVIDLAVGIIIGNAFTAIVTSLVDDMISPILGLMGNKDLAAYNAVMRPGLSGNTSYPTPAQAKADQAITLAWGNFINSIINFFLIAIVVFLMIKFIGLFYRKKESIVQVCWWCREPLKGDARRCDNCGSVIPSRAQEKVMEVMEKRYSEHISSAEGMTDLDKAALQAQLNSNMNALMIGAPLPFPIPGGKKLETQKTAATAAGVAPAK